MISKRVQGFTESVIREMTRVNQQYNGINLAQGMPNFRPPRAIDGDALRLQEAAVTALDLAGQLLRRSPGPRGAILLLDAHQRACSGALGTKIRFCFPKTDDMLIEAGRRLQKLAR